MIIKEIKNKDYATAKELEKDFLKEIKSGGDGVLSKNKALEIDYMIVSKGKIIGFCCFLKNCQIKKQLVLEELFIKKEFRNKGIGKKFLNHMISIVKKDYSKIIVCPKNDTINFYSKFGFKKRNCGDMALNFNIH